MDECTNLAGGQALIIVRAVQDMSLSDMRCDNIIGTYAEYLAIRAIWKMENIPETGGIFDMHALH